MPNFLQARKNMIASQLKTWGVLNPPLLALMLQTPREKFIPIAYQALAYADTAIPLFSDQSMLTPKILARGIQALDIQASDHILEIGTGSGYSTLLLSRLGKQLTSIEILPELFAYAKKNLNTFSPNNIELLLGNGALGYYLTPPKTFDKILVTGSYADGIPEALLHQLNPGGKLFAFVGKDPIHEGIVISKSVEHILNQESLFETLVTPLIEAPAAPLFKL